LSHAMVKGFDDLAAGDCGGETPLIDEIHQFVAFDGFQPAVGQGHKCARGDQRLHHLLVTVIEIAGYARRV
jgi:hypothetical protein